MPRRGLRLKVRRPRTPTGSSSPVTITNTDYQIDIAWAEAAAGDTFATWQVERGQSSSGPWVILSSTIPFATRTYTDTELAYGATAYYRVGANQTNGNVTPYTTATSATRTGADAVDLGSSDFNGTTGNTLTQYDADLILTPYSTGAAVISAQGRAMSGASDTGRSSFYRGTTVPAVASYRSTITTHWLTLTQRSAVMAAVNLHPTQETGYLGGPNQWQQDGRWEIQRRSNGSPTVLASLNSQKLTDGQSATIMLERVGNTLYLKKNGTTIITVSDPNPLPDIGYAGFWVQGNGVANVGIHGENWTAEVPGGSADTTAPAQPTLTTTLGIGVINLSLDHSADGVTGARFYRSRVSGGPYTRVATTGSTADPITAYDAAPLGFDYYYVASVVDAVGNESPLSDEETIYADPLSSPNIIRPSTSLTLTRTFNSIGIELPFTGDANQNAAAAMEFKKSVDSTWIEGLPLWGTYSTDADTPGFAFYGSALELDDGTLYDIRVTITDPDGVADPSSNIGPITLTGQIQTRSNAEVPNVYDVTGELDLSHSYFTGKTIRYISTTGNDTTGDGSESTPWRTILKAEQTAPSGAVVVVEPGRPYDRPTTWRATPIDFFARYAAVDDDRNIINVGNHSIVESTHKTNAGGSTWTLYNPTGLVNTGTNYPVWKWTSAPITGVSLMHVAETLDQDEIPHKIANWSVKTDTYGGYSMSTPQGWAEVAHTNNTYGYGFVQFGSDIYVRMPGDRDPNDYHVWIGRAWDDSYYWRRQCPNSRISGLHIRQQNINWYHGANNTVTDRCLMVDTEVHFQNDTRTNYTHDHVVQYCKAVSSDAHWTLDPTWPAMPWYFIKGAVWTENFEGNWNNVGKGSQESRFIGGWGGLQKVIRHCDIDGYHNGIVLVKGKNDRYAHQDTDIHDCLITHIQDDCVEPEGYGINLRIWDCHFFKNSVTVSTGPSNFGPIYLWRSRSRPSCEGVEPVYQLPPGESLSKIRGINPKGFKFSASSAIPPRIHIVGCTFAGDEASTEGASLAAAGSGGVEEGFWIRNSIFICTRYITSGAPLANRRLWNEDYNHFYTSDISTRGINDFNNMAAYRSFVANTSGVHSNTNADLKNAWIIDQFSGDPFAGVFDLDPASPLVDAGVSVPNIATGTQSIGWEAP